MRDGPLTGDGGALRNTWEGLCVQVQGEHSWAWNSYLETLESIVERACRGLSATEELAVWLQTPQGEDWATGEKAETEEPPVFMSDVCTLMVGRVLSHASNWSNARIERFLQREHD